MPETDELIKYIHRNSSRGPIFAIWLATETEAQIFAVSTKNALNAQQENEYKLGLPTRLIIEYMW